MTLGLTRAHDGLSLVGARAGGRVEPPETPVDAATVRTGPRVGVSGAGGDGTAYPWRFWLDGEPTVSAYRVAIDPERQGRLMRPTHAHGPCRRPRRRCPALAACGSSSSEPSPGAASSAAVPMVTAARSHGAGDGPGHGHREAGRPAGAVPRAGRRVLAAAVPGHTARRLGLGEQPTRLRDGGRRPPGGAPTRSPAPSTGRR